MPFTDGQRTQIQNHFQQHGRCPMCQTNNWELVEDFIAPVVLDVEYQQPIQGKSLPMVALVCSECGIVVQLSAVKIGLI